MALVEQVEALGEETVAPEKRTDWSERIFHYVYLGKLILRRYWWILILTTGLGVGWQSFQATQAKPTFTSRAKLMLSTLSVNAGAQGVREEFFLWFGTQIEILTNQQTRRAAIERVRAFHPEIEPVPVRVSANQISGTVMIGVNATSDSREFTPLFLDALLDEYISARQRMKGETSERAVLAITERIDALEETIRQQEDAVVDFRRQNNLVFIEEQRGAAGRDVREFKDRRAEFANQLRLLDSVGVAMHLANPEIFGANLSLVSVSLQQGYRDTAAQLAQAEAARAEFSAYLRERHPKMITLTDDIRRLENLLNVYSGQAVEQVEQRRDQLLAQMDDLDIRIAEREAIALENSRLAAEFDRLESNLTRSRNLYESLLRSIQNLETGQELSPEVVSVFERASHPSTNRVDMMRQIQMGFVAGLGLGVGLLVLLGLLDGRVIASEDLKQKFNLPVLGIIPAERRPRGQRLERLKIQDARHLFSEACRALRSAIFFVGDGEQRPTSLLITSSVPEEGKSTISTSLSAAIAFTSARVLLVDCDLRRGHLHEEFGLERAPGLSECLLTGRRLDGAIQATGVDNLDFLPTGSLPDRPGELLLSAAMDDLLEAVSQRYDYVIFDSAPILATEDTTAFAAKCDALLFVVRSTSTQTRQVRSSLDRLAMRNVEPTGFVLNFVDTKGTDYYYYKKYNDYYAYAPR